MKDGINVLSVFDGMSCGQIALQRAGIKVNNYFASEIDSHAIKVTQTNFPNTVQLGDITKVKASDLPKIDLLIGGSPCQGFSFMGKQLNFDDERSKLFFEFVRLKNELNPKNFLLENVRMKYEYELVISKLMKVEAVEIDSGLLSAQRRLRLYWTDINLKQYGLFGEFKPDIPQPKDKGICIKDILEPQVSDKYYLKTAWLKWFKKNRDEQLSKGFISYNNHDGKAITMMAITMTARQYANYKGNFISDVIQLNPSNEAGNQPQQQDRVYDIRAKSPSLIAGMSCHTHAILETEERVRRFTPVECERLQTVPDGYTSSVSDSQAYKMLGNGWNVDTIVHILSYLK